MNSKPNLSDLITVPFIRQADLASRLPWSYGERKLLDYLLVYIEHGHCRFSVNRQVYDLLSGDFCLIQPGDLLTLEGLTETRTPFAHLDFFYNPLRELSFPTSAGMIHLDNFLDFMQPRLNDFPGISIPVVFRPEQPILFQNKLIRMIGHWKEGTVLGNMEAQQMGTEILIELLRIYGIPSDQKKTPSAMLERVHSYLSLHLNEPITVKKMAELVHLSPSRFTAVFREKYGKSPYRFLLELRVERAIEMMRTVPDSGFQQISDYCGFGTVQHFSQAFRSIIGQSPSRYREDFLFTASHGHAFDNSVGQPQISNQNR